MSFIASTPAPLLANYNGSLTSTSGVFFRPLGSTTSYFYFQALQVSVAKAGTYIFTSNSTMDTRGYFYQTSFDPSNATLNLIADNDDGAGQRQFRIEVYILPGRAYVLVVTTHGANTMGDFSISATGPGMTTLTSITPVTSQPIVTGKFYYYYYSCCFQIEYLA